MHVFVMITRSKIQTTVEAYCRSAVFKIFLFCYNTIICAYTRKIVAYENTFRVLCFEKRSANVFNDAYPTTNAFLSENIVREIDYIRDVVHRT